MEAGIEEASPGRRSAVSRWLARLQLSPAVLVVLGVLVAAYTVLFSELSLLRNAEFFTSNWDLGVNQQMLWSTGHGHLLYEAGDYIGFGITSYLELHSTYIALAFVPVYLVVPTPLTLFALQALAAALAIVPLYLVSIEVLRSRTLTFAVLALYLASFPVTSGLMFDFHWEAFLPLEFLFFWYFYSHARYRAAFAVLVVGCCTLEIFPFLAVMVPIVVYLARRGSLALPPFAEARRRFVAFVRRAWALREGRVAIWFIIACVAAYGLVRAVQWFLVPILLQKPPSVSVALGHGAGLIGLVTFSLSSSSLFLSGDYWLLLFAALGFLPLLHPRYLLLVLPWFVFVTFINPYFSSEFGTQYALVIIGPLLVASVQGLGRLRTWFLASPERAVGPAALITISAAMMAAFSVVPGSAGFLQGQLADALAGYTFFLPVLAVFGLGVGWLLLRSRSGPRAPAVLARSGRRQRFRAEPRRAVSTAVLVSLAILVGFNLVMSPMNTANYSAIPGYRFSYTTSPVAPRIGALTSLIPGNAVLLVSDFLFPYVANDVNAVGLPWFGNFESDFPYFPFGPTNLPAYVLVDSAEYDIVPPYFQALLWNASTYGLRGEIYSTAYPGTVYLFELGYHGSPLEVNATVFQNTSYLGAPPLSIGSMGEAKADPASRFGEVIATNPNASFVPGNPNIWYGPYAVYPAGTYRITLSLSVDVLVPQYHPNTPVLLVNAGPNYLPPLYEQNLTVRELSSPGWTSFVFNVTIPEPYPMMEFRGYAVEYYGGPAALVTLNYLEVQQTG